MTVILEWESVAELIISVLIAAAITYTIVVIV